jgi:hypothetical protein
VPQEVCRNELYHQLKLSSKGCSTVNCNRNHFELTKLAKPTLVAACEAIPNPDFKNKVLAAIGALPP